MRRPEWPVLGQRYRLIRQIDSGGMGSVWLAEAVHLRSLVAVKVMGRALAATPEAAQRFLHEARTAASLRSPHVVQILDYGVHDSTPFIAMELLEGESLATRLRRDGRLASWEQTELVLRHVARALARAHDAGVIHRDLKPGNIFLVRDEEEEIVKLLDFGIAKTTLSPLGAPLRSDTRTGEFLGSPAYASPEQLQASKAIDHRADIWSLGVIAYECLLGRAPFAADSFVGMLLAICTGPLPVPSEQGPVPPGFDAWFARVCAREVEQRFQSVREASAELRRLVDAARGSPAALAAAAAAPAAEQASPEPLNAVPSAPDGLLAPPVDGGPRPPLDAGEPPPGSLTAPMPLVAPNDLGWPPVAPPSPRTDTVPLAPPRADAEPRRRNTALTMLLVLPAVVVLVFFTLDASSSRALDWSRLGLGAATSGAPERDPAARAPDGARQVSALPGVASPAAVPATPPESASRADGPSALAAGGVAPAGSDDPSPSAAAEPGRSPAIDALPTEGDARTSEPEPAPEPQRASRPGPEPAAAPPRRPVTASAPGSARPSSARLTVTASAPSMVLIDGVPFGTTPLQSIRVEPGTHEVVFIQDGKRSAETLTIRSGEHKRVDAGFDALPGDGLSEAAVKRTIKTNREAVVDTCWQYAFAARSPGDPTSVRVPVTVSVEPSGDVRSVVTAAEPPGYPALRRCVEERVSAWTFPSARAETVVNVAFVFVLR